MIRPQHHGALVLGAGQAAAHGRPRALLLADRRGPGPGRPRIHPGDDPRALGAGAMAWLEIPAIDAARAPARQNRIMRKLVGVISALASADPHNTIYAAAPFAPGSAAMLCAADESAPGGSRLPAGSSRCPRCAARLVKLAGRPTAHPGAGSQRHYLLRPAGRLSARGVATLIGMCVAGSRVSEAEQAYRSPCSARPARPPSRPSLPRVTAVISSPSPGSPTGQELLRR